MFSQSPTSFFSQPSNSVTIDQLLFYLAQSLLLNSNSHATQVSLKIFRNLALKGHSSAWYQLGICYLKGDNVKQNINKGAGLIKRAAIMGVPAAQYSLAQMLYKGVCVKQNFILASTWMLRAAQSTHVDAQIEIAHSHELGRGVAYNFQAALFWYKAAAAQGSGDAEELLETLQNAPEHKTAESKPALNDQSLARIPYGELILVSHLGSGGNGAVYKARWISQNKDVAVKFSIPGNYNSFKKEAILSARAQSANVIKVYGYCDSPRCCLVMDYAAQGSLTDLMDKSYRLSEEYVYQLAIEILDGLKYVHDKDISHNDIQFDNILIDEHGKAKIGDFGCSELMTNNKSNKLFDLYATGRLLRSLAAGRELDPDSEMKPIPKNILQNKLMHRLFLVGQFVESEDPSTCDILATAIDDLKNNTAEPMSDIENDFRLT